MVNWRSAAYIGLFLIPACMLASGCGEPGDPPPDAADQEEGYEIEIDFGQEIEPPVAEPPVTESNESSDTPDSSEPDSDDESVSGDVAEGGDVAEAAEESTESDEP